MYKFKCDKLEITLIDSNFKRILLNNNFFWGGNLLVRYVIPTKYMPT